MIWAYFLCSSYFCYRQVWGSDEEADASSDEEAVKKNQEENDRQREEAEMDAVYEFMASQRTNRHSMQQDSSDEEFSDIDEESNDGRFSTDNRCVRLSLH